MKKTKHEVVHVVPFTVDPNTHSLLFGGYKNILGVDIATKEVIVMSNLILRPLPINHLQSGLTFIAYPVDFNCLKSSCSKNIPGVEFKPYSKIRKKILKEICKNVQAAYMQGFFVEDVKRQI